ncbi:NAC domain-containing protein 55-like [Tripterygium wilfordii]|uniref:NAC domain-containing protein 55-like n=1 Tax=Tripterygium wilfordii TaxID=458696 RepID=A0A7J7CGG2_TRIWF|nr:NAC domain-containing protein 35-like [Tripterygium wilfordii]KAF5733138.1 NAC domain-containing protein 55-like [Tripterygium wilfordii]
MNEENNNNMSRDEAGDDHEHDMVMPGFRFHPTEEELVEFYLRRKVEGKRFNVELITFLDLYRYDPWELPAMAAIGEKEWFFYVPRDRKYRNGDRPNRVTTSGYWKATGADRMIRGENSRSIGLKKTLVFYSGKAPKGIRTSWIMNEYRLPHHDTEKYQKTEISLCRVYKRAGVEDHPSLPRSLPSRPSSSSSSRGLSGKKHPHQESLTAHLGIQRVNAFGAQLEMEKITTTTETTTDCSSSSDVSTVLGSSKHNSYHPIPAPQISPSLGLPVVSMEEEGMLILNQSKLQQHALLPNCPSTTRNLLTGIVSNDNIIVDDLHRLVNYQQQASLNMNQHQQYYYNNHHQLISTSTNLLPEHPPVPLNMLLPPANSLPSTAFSDQLWEWNQVPEPNRDYNNNPFK